MAFGNDKTLDQQTTPAHRSRRVAMRPFPAIRSVVKHEQCSKGEYPNVIVYLLQRRLGMRFRVRRSEVVHAWNNGVDLNCVDRTKVFPNSQQPLDSFAVFAKCCKYMYLLNYATSIRNDPKRQSLLLSFYLAGKKCLSARARWVGGVGIHWFLPCQPGSRSRSRCRTGG